MIKLINVVKKFGKIEAVKGINLEVEKGSLFAFLGENGAGKSTTLSMICTESEPTSGEIFIDDEKLTFKNRKLFRQKLGVVFQEMCWMTYSRCAKIYIIVLVYMGKQKQKLRND